MARKQKPEFPPFLVASADNGYYEPTSCYTPEECLTAAREIVDEGYGAPVIVYQACKKIDFAPVEVEIEQVSF